ncbi:MAG: hypothetical protein ABSE79_23055 [Terriglobia bacterium]
MAVVIETPFPSMRKVAKTLGVSVERGKEIERLVEKHYEALAKGPVFKLRSGNKRESARPRNGRHH